MDYVQFGRTGVRVSELCLGTANFGWLTDEKPSIRIIHKALDAGINFIDTANAYGNGRSEEIVGKALREAGARDRVFLATKVRTRVGEGPNDEGVSRRHIMVQVDRSLRRLGTDWIDLYQIHAPDETTPIDETARALDDLVRTGKIRYCGTSNFPGWQLCEAQWTTDRLGLAPFVSEQPPYNILQRGIEREVLPFCEKYGVAVMSYGPVARGWLSGKYRKGSTRVVEEKSRMGGSEQHLTSPEGLHRLEVIEQVIAHAEAKGTTITRFALAWARSNPHITTPIIGPRTEEHLDDNLASLAVAITEEDRKRVDDLVAPGLDIL